MTVPGRPSVLHVAQPPDSGVTNVVAALMADQLARGWQMTVAAPGGSELVDHSSRLGARMVRWEARRAPGPTLPSEMIRLARIVDDVHPDLIHLHSAKAGLAGRLVLRRRRATVFQPHAWSFEAMTGPLRAATIGWERLGARWADAIVCVSHDERLRAAQVGIRGCFAEIPNGVDLDRFAPAGSDDRARARKALGLEDSPTAVLLGRLFRQKGQDTMLRAWGHVLERVPRARLVLVGDGPERAALEAIGAESVHFAGTAVDVTPWIAASDVVVLPSRWEGMSLAVLEAMACARSVVATDVAGMRDGLLPGCGAVVAVNAEEPLAEAVAERLLDPELCRREGAAGRTRVEERYALTTATARMATLYGDVWDRRSRGGGYYRS